MGRNLALRTFEVSSQGRKNSTKTANDTAPEMGGCGMFPWTTFMTKPEIKGAYFTNFNFGFTVTATAWGNQTIVEINNDENYAITQNPADDEFNPSKFNKIVWTDVVNGQFFYCTVDFGLATADAALATTKTADASNPSMSGCGGFAWTQTQLPIEITGLWTSNFGGVEGINAAKFGVNRIHEFDNDNNWVVIQNPSDDMWNPDKFARIVWTDVSGDSFYYCWVDFGLDTAEMAKTSTNTADATDPDNSGCGGFSWTKLTK